SAKSGKVESASVEGRTIKWVSTDKKRYITYSPGDIWMVGDLVKYGVKVEAKPEEEQSFLAQIFISWFPMLLLIGVWIFFMRQMQGGGRGGAFSFGKSRARMMDESTNTVTFADVAGCEEAKDEVAELVDFLRDPSTFQKLGGRIARGVLMVGAPGRDRDRRHQPPGRARPGAPAPGPLRPPGGGAAAGYPRARRDPQGAHAESSAGTGREARHHRARHARFFRGRPRQPGQ